MKMYLPYILLLLNYSALLGQHKEVNKKTLKSIMISSGQIYPAKPIFDKTIHFELVLKDKDTIYIQTMDSKFHTPEGVYVGQNFQELNKEIKKNLIKEIGWGYYYRLTSGWSIGFCEGTSCTDKYPDENSTIKWIFKRN